LVTEYLQWAKASIESPYGTVVNSWKKDDDKINWLITIPANSSGSVSLPKGKNITVNSIKLSLEKITSTNSDNETALYHFPSGIFNVQIGQ